MDAYIYKRSSKIKIRVERVNQASKLTRTEVNDIIEVAVNCVHIVEQILRQSPRRDENMTLRFCNIDPSGVVDRFCRRNEWPIK